MNNVTISNRELNESGSASAAAAIKEMCDILAFDAAVQEELATINDLCDNGQQVESDERLDAFSVNLSFNGRRLTLNLSNMDVYDQFVRLLDVALSEIDLYR